jgi:hypothetical protein
MVYTYRPSSWDRSGPVLIIIPGAGRIGTGSRDTWIPYSEKYSSLLVVPEFSEQYYPGDLWYAGGNLFDIGGHMNPQSNWTYTAVEHLFDEVRQRSGTTRDTYLLFGHSAGAQFVHRLVTFLPGARYSRAVAANAGLYVFPVYPVQYPFGLKDSPLPEGDLPMVFARKLIVMSGADDTNPNDSSLPNFPAAKAQGSTRFERARLYINTARAEAARRNVTIEWEYSVVMGVGHSESGMAGPSARRLFE